MQCLPDSLLGRSYYRPTDQGLEIRYQERLKQIKAWKALQAPGGIRKKHPCIFRQKPLCYRYILLYWRDDG